MAQFTTGHLNDLARVIHAERERCDMTPERLYGVNELTNNIANMLERSNPRFNKLRFLNACIHG